MAWTYNSEKQSDLARRNQNNKRFYKVVLAVTAALWVIVHLFGGNSERVERVDPDHMAKAADQEHDRSAKLALEVQAKAEAEAEAKERAAKLQREAQEKAETEAKERTAKLAREAQAKTEAKAKGTTIAIAEMAAIAETRAKAAQVEVEAKSTPPGNASHIAQVLSGTLREHPPAVALDRFIDRVLDHFGMAKSEMNRQDAALVAAMAENVYDANGLTVMLCMSVYPPDAVRGNMPLPWSGGFCGGAFGKGQN